jgi:hypothetical protein
VVLLLTALSTCVPQAHSIFDASVFSKTEKINSVVAVNAQYNVSLIGQLSQLVYEVGQLTDQVALLQTNVSLVNLTYSNGKNNVNYLNDTLTWNIRPNQVANDYFSFQNAYNVTNANFVTLSDSLNATKQDFNNQVDVFQTSSAIVLALAIVVPILLMLIATKMWLRKIGIREKRLDEQLSLIRQ